MSVFVNVIVVAVTATANPLGSEPAALAALMVITAPTAAAVYSGEDVWALMLAATAAAVVGRSVVNDTEPDMIFTLSTVIIFTEPLAPPVSVTVAVAATLTGVRSVTIELLPVASIVKRSSVLAPPEWQ